MRLATRYKHDHEGLFQLAQHLASQDPVLQRRAAEALRQDALLRCEVSLVTVSVEHAAEASANGHHVDVADLAKFRVIAGILPRLQELEAADDRRVRSSATAAIRGFNPSTGTPAA
jgi:predicted TIM-barrel enzyme